MTQLQLMEHAKEYITSLSQGVNPLNNEALNEDEVIANIRVSKCLSYISDLLGEIIENEGNIDGRFLKGKTPFYITYEQRKRLIDFFRNSDEIMEKKDIAQKVNEIAAENNCAKFAATWFIAYLANLGFLTGNISSLNTIPTSQGKEMGINKRGKYWLMFKPEAQRFIAEHIFDIVDFSKTTTYFNMAHQAN